MGSVGKREIPDDKILIPGLLTSTSNYVEHPEFVAQRICQFADIVGRERVIAGTDCGFGTFAGIGKMDAGISFKKLKALVQGAELAPAPMEANPVGPGHDIQSTQLQLSGPAKGWCWISYFSATISSLKRCRNCLPENGVMHRPSGDSLIGRDAIYQAYQSGLPAVLPATSARTFESLSIPQIMHAASAML